MAQHVLGSSESLVADGITALDMHKKAMSLTCGEGFMGHDSVSTEYGPVGLGSTQEGSVPSLHNLP